MEIEERLNVNIDKIKGLYPDFPIKLPFLDTQAYQIESNEKGQENLVFQDGNDKKNYCYPQEDVYKDIDQWIEEEPFNISKGIYIYGVGLGYHFDRLQEWLEKDPGHFLVFIEDDLCVFKKILEREQGTKLLEHPQVEILYLSDFSIIKKWASELSWLFVSHHICFTALPYYQKNKEENTELLKQHLISESITTFNMVNECTNQSGFQYFDNFYHNLVQFNRSKEGCSLIEKFRNKPMILCGAGPSLNSNVAYLKELSDKAMIMAGGSAMKALFRNGVTPHFGSGVDPTDKEYELFRDQYGFEMPIFSIPRLSHLAHSIIHGPSLLLVGRKGEYSMQKWIEDKLGVKTTNSWGGVSVLTFSLSIALQLGANPIIFVGADLANTGNKKYAQGVVDKVEVNIENPRFEGNWWLGGVDKEDIYGKPIHTQWKWVIESNWISNLAKNHPEVKFINATEGGIGFEGVENLSLKETAKQYLSKNLDVNGLIHQSIALSPKIDLPSERVFEELGELYASFDRTSALCEDLCDAIKISAFMMGAESDLMPFDELERMMLERIEQTEDSPKEQKELLEYLLKIQNMMEEFTTLCQGVLDKIKGIEKRWENKDGNPIEMQKSLKSELAYKYSLEDLHKMYSAKNYRQKQGLRSVKNENKDDLFNSLKELQSRIKTIKFDLCEFQELSRNCHLHKVLIEEVVRHCKAIGEDVEPFYRFREGADKEGCNVQRAEVLNV
jgi:hypothetical protein